MAGAIIWCVSVFGSAALLYGIGVYAGRSEKPMHFWSGSEVKPEEILDIPSYNRENARMWKLYSLWFWVAGLGYFVNAYAAVIILVIGSTAGGALLVARYLRIEKKYRVKK
ncbi:MAG: hypothetical protein IKT57_08675 [Clostridia bacterium]|nr:hypothetical protein [Clostridia bacterium]